MKASAFDVALKPLMRELLTLHQSFENQGKVKIFSFRSGWGGGGVAAGKNFMFTINLSKRQEAGTPACFWLRPTPFFVEESHRMMVMQLEFMHKLLYKKSQGGFKG